MATGPEKAEQERTARGGGTYGCVERQMNQLRGGRQMEIQPEKTDGWRE